MRLKCKLVVGVRVAVMLLAGGCRHAPTAASDTGRSSFAFVDGPDAAVAEAAVTVEEPKSGDYFREAVLIGPPATPVYPPKALAAKVGLTTIGVRITVDINGRVADIGPSLLAISIPTKFDGEFQEAVRVAVVQWRFLPAQNYHVEIVALPEGGAYARVTNVQNTETSFDLAFTFTATGTVLGGVPGK